MKSHVRLVISALICLHALPSFSKNVGQQVSNKIPVGPLLECEDLEGYLNDIDPEYTRECNLEKIAKWNYMTNVDETTRQAYITAKNALLTFLAGKQKEIKDEGFLDCSIDQVPDVAARREVKYLSTHGPGNMAPADYEKLTSMQTQFELAYATARVCEFENDEKCDLRLEPDIERKLQTSENLTELEWYWTQWHDQINSVISPSDFMEMTRLQNELAVSNGFGDMSELWLHKYDDDTETWSPDEFKDTLLSLWTELQPSYAKLLAFVRMQLRAIPEYKDKVKRFGALPMHATRHVWSQHWLYLDSITKPFPDVEDLDFTERLQWAGLTVDDLFEHGNIFLHNLSLPELPQEVWANSILERPDDREFICDASAEDFCSTNDFRLKLCAEVTMKDLLRASKYTGYVEYFLQYASKHYMFRSAANPAFFEGLTNTFAMITSTPVYLQCKAGLNVGLEIECPVEGLEPPYDSDVDVNYLYRAALEKLPQLAFAMSVNAWRWELYDGEITPEELNQRWYEIRAEYQGVLPPMKRNANGVDAAAIHDILAEDDEFTKQFVGTILQFQIHEALCIIAGEYNPNPLPLSKPLHQCDFSENAAVGQKLSEVMSKGFERPWPEILSDFTGRGNLSTSSILKYLRPLFIEIDKRLGDEETCFGKNCQALAREYVSVAYEAESSRLCNNASLASWAYETDLTNPEAEAENAAANLRYAQFRNTQWKDMISQFDIDSFDESDEKRQLTFLNSVGVAALETEDLEEFNQLLSSMSKIYGTAKVCPYNNQECDLETEGLSLEPGLESVMANSRIYNELAYVWREWRAATGRLMRQDYNRYVDLSNVAAEINGYDNMGDFWIHRYESETFKTDMEAVWLQVQEMYTELHAYVRYRLRETYPEMGRADALIPAHVLGNMWSQTWSNIYSLVLPFKDAPVFDVTEKLKQLLGEDAQGIRQMFDIANTFFRSIGLDDMGVSYGPKAMITKPTDGREVICHASAWDFCDGEDFRIKMCTEVDMEDLITVHHELGHIQYDLQYKHLNITFREGANPGFHEAIGDVISLSVATPKHMHKLGLVDQPETTDESTINYLMKMALDKIAFLPFGFLIDSYRWRVFDGTIPRENLTYNWLKMRSDFQGIRPAEMRNEEDFDPGAKYHVPGDVPYIRYFFSYILQFQVHRALCVAAHEYDPTDPEKPLHNCDIYQNADAGRIFKRLLESGGSKNWETLLQEVIGEPGLTAEPLVEYFRPLVEYFQDQRAEHGYPLGWDHNEFENYFGEGELPSSPDPPTTTTTTTTTSTTTTTTTTPSSTGPTDDPSEPTPDPGTTPTTTTTTTEDPTTTTTTIPTPPSDDDDGGVNVAALVLGIILALVIVGIVVGYFVAKKMGLGPFAKKSKRELLVNE